MIKVSNSQIVATSMGGGIVGENEGTLFSCSFAKSTVESDTNCGGITGYNSNSAGATLGVGLAAGLVGMAADAMVEDVNYTMITDVQIAERTKATVTTDNVAALRQGTSGAKIQTSTETGNQHKYQTRVVSNANKVNLKFEEAKPVLEDQLAKSIANIL